MNKRLLSLDAFRGFIILAMIWVNYIAGMPNIPYWLEHAGPKADGITLPDLVFPGFLFIVGIAIPLSLHRSIGRVDAALIGRLLWRAASLMVAGLVLANAYRYDPAAALLPRPVWLLLFYVAMILLWRQGEQRGYGFWAGAALMVFVLASFRGTLNEEFSSPYLQHTWWGILGMIGWAYLLCSAIYLAARGDGAVLMAALAALIALYMGGTAGALAWLPRAVQDFVNVPQVLGSTGANVLAGAIVGRLFVRGADPQPEGMALHAPRLRFMAWFAAGLFAAGMLLRPYHGINKIQATESYTLVCAAIILALFLLFYLLIDVWELRGWTVLLLPAGANALFAYIAPDLWEQAAALLHLPRLWWPYLESGGAAGLLNAAVMTFVMMVLTALANRLGLKLKF
ncbi:DUF5009 domain-containing protein [Massilia endophytica]|uniref:DUF5009 domain-containing protein n=1 Tax=Massilia endophytica TaxID=2899220 RepID=UPI001E657D68|nr:DUF5009 domain-containing protein [Massilia endophytica]UGQ47496.1 DUF5009 domain-containing protein [Massilia endophytica]